MLTKIKKEKERRSFSLGNQDYFFLSCLAMKEEKLTRRALTILKRTTSEEVQQRACRDVKDRICRDFRDRLVSTGSDIFNQGWQDSLSFEDMNTFGEELSRLEALARGFHTAPMEPKFEEEVLSAAEEDALPFEENIPF